MRSPLLFTGDVTLVCPWAGEENGLTCDTSFNVSRLLRALSRGSTSPLHTEGTKREIQYSNHGARRCSSSNTRAPSRSKKATWMAKAQNRRWPRTTGQGRRKPHLGRSTIQISTDFIKAGFCIVSPHLTSISIMSLSFGCIVTLTSISIMSLCFCFIGQQVYTVSFAKEKLKMNISVLLGTVSRNNPCSFKQGGLTSAVSHVRLFPLWAPSGVEGPIVQDNAESRESSEQAESESEDNPYHRRGIPAQEGLLWKRSLNNAERALSMTRKRLQSGRLADA
ncbi:unnamed protein product, partial [Nesidiocoris tenuis]